MAECVENGVLNPMTSDTATSADKSALKLNTHQDEQPKQNGVTCEGDNLPSDQNNHSGMDWSPSETTGVEGNENGAADSAPASEVDNERVKVNGSGDSLLNNENSNISEISEKSSVVEDENSRSSFKEEAGVEDENSPSSFKEEAVVEGENSCSSFKEEAGVEDENSRSSFKEEAGVEDENIRSSFKEEAGVEDENSHSSFKEEAGVVEGENSPSSFKEEAGLVEGEKKDEGLEKIENVSEKDVDDSNSAVSVNAGDQSPAEDNSEAMEVGEDSSDVNANTNSNLSAPGSDVAEVGGTTSQDASVISEDSSRDSSDSSASVNLKDEEGGDILITLNDENDKDDDKSDNNAATDVNIEKNENIVKADKSGDADGVDISAAKKPESPSAVDSASKSSDIQKSTPTATGIATNVPTSTVLIQGSIGQQIPAGAQLLQQGNQLGYITTIGSQSIFVPVSANVQSQQQGKVALMALNQQQGTPQANVPINQSILQPQSSLEMIERMRFELQNRIPDNHNWSVAFHPKKEELSSITSFLLELGHDVVKEAVYKDIIKIQTKKKEDKALKDNEVESLEKMKTVYENTKKKVDHLQLKKVDCKGCRFRTESAVVMNHHKDFPHYDPPWDMSKGWMLCARCKYRTRVLAQFSFHMETVHKTQAKLLEKPQLFQCELCPLNTTTKNKLEKHRAKCIKHFKLNVNLQPYFHDVNFSMKTCYYKPKKIIPKPTPPPAQKQGTPRPATPAARPTMQTRQNQPMPPKLQNYGRPQVPPKPAPGALRQPPHLQMRQRMSQPRPVVPQQRPGMRAPLRGGNVGQNMSPRPSVPQQPRPARPPSKEMSGFEVCELCGGYVKDRQALRIHFYYAHKVEMPQAIFNRPVPPLSCDVCQSKFWTTQGLSKHKSTLRHYANQSPIQGTTPPAPTTSMQTCFMCSRKVTNLFVHIEQYHGMTMKDLVAMRKCIMCGMTASDRRSLETHMATAHGVLIKTNDILGPEKPNASPGAATTPPTKTTPENKAANSTGMNRPSVKPSPLARNNLCVFCQIQFADNIQLTMHCIKAHATCSACGMVVASNNNLTNHNCKQMKRNCSICGLKNIAPDIYAVHLRTHVKQCNVSLTRMSDDEISEVRSKVKKEYKPQIISLDSDEDSDIEVIESKSDDDEVDDGTPRRMGPRSKTRMNKVKKAQPDDAAEKGVEAEAKSEQNDSAEVKSESADEGVSKVDDKKSNDKDAAEDTDEKEVSDIKMEAEGDGESSKNDDVDEGENETEAVEQPSVDGEKAPTDNSEIKQEGSDMDAELGDQDKMEAEVDGGDTLSDKSGEEPDVPVKSECSDSSEHGQDLPDNSNEIDSSDPIEHGDEDIPNIDKSPVDNVERSDSAWEGHPEAGESNSNQGIKRGLDESNESGIASDDEQMAKRLKTESENPAGES